MKLAIINGSIQENNTSSKVSRAFYDVVNDEIDAELLHLDSFDTLFTGEYISLKNSDGKNLEILTVMKYADILVFVVPTYFKSMPGALKNFFDIVRDADIFANKTVAIIANNHKNQDYGARHVRQVVEGLSVFYSASIYIVPEILIVHHEDIKVDELRRFSNVVKEFHARLE